VISDGGVAAAWVVEAFDELEHRDPRLGLCSEPACLEQFAFERGKEALGDLKPAPALVIVSIVCSRSSVLPPAARKSCADQATKLGAHVGRVLNELRKEDDRCSTNSP
jgi:hypothetical protein